MVVLRLGLMFSISYDDISDNILFSRDNVPLNQEIQKGNNIKNIFVYIFFTFFKDFFPHDSVVKAFVTSFMI
jgi:hypothetical protein